MFRPIDIVFAVAALGLPLVGCSSAGKSRTIHLPSGSISPTAIDESFLSRVDSLVAVGAGETRLVCLIRFDSDGRGEPTGDTEILRELAGNARIILARAAVIRTLANKRGVRWIGEYRAGYKYNKTLAGARAVWVYVESFRGDREAFRHAMNEVGISQIEYRRSPERYYIKANGDQIVDIAGFWWVENIYRAHRWGRIRS